MIVYTTQRVIIAFKNGYRKPQSTFRKAVAVRPEIEQAVVRRKHLSHATVVWHAEKFEGYHAGPPFHYVVGTAKKIRKINRPYHVVGPVRPNLRDERVTVVHRDVTRQTERRAAVGDRNPTRIANTRAIDFGDQLGRQLEVVVPTGLGVLLGDRFRLAVEVAPRVLVPAREVGHDPIHARLKDGDALVGHTFHGFCYPFVLFAWSAWSGVRTREDLRPRSWSPARR